MTWNATSHPKKREKNKQNKQFQKKITKNTHFGKGYTCFGHVTITDLVGMLVIFQDGSMFSHIIRKGLVGTF